MVNGVVSMIFIVKFVYVVLNGWGCNVMCVFEIIEKLSDGVSVEVDSFVGYFFFKLFKEIILVRL